MGLDVAGRQPKPRCSINTHNPSGTSHGLDISTDILSSLTTDADGSCDRCTGLFILIRY